MTHDAMDESNRPSTDRSSTADEEREEDSRKPFVKPKLRREEDLVDGTGTDVSWHNPD